MTILVFVIKLIVKKLYILIVYFIIFIFLFKTEMVKLGGIIFYVVFMFLAIAAGIMAVIHASKAYKGVHNSETDNIQKVYIFDIVILCIMGVGFIIFCLIFIMMLFNKMSSRFLLFAALLSFVGILFLLSAFYLIFITINLVTTLLPIGISDVKHNISLSATYSIATLMFVIIAVVALLSASSDIKEETCLKELEQESKYVGEKETSINLNRVAESPSRYL